MANELDRKALAHGILEAIGGIGGAVGDAASPGVGTGIRMGASGVEKLIDLLMPGGDSATAKPAATPSPGTPKAETPIPKQPPSEPVKPTRTRSFDAPLFRSQDADLQEESQGKDSNPANQKNAGKTITPPAEEISFWRQQLGRLELSPKQRRYYEDKLTSAGNAPYRRPQDARLVWEKTLTQPLDAELREYYTEQLRALPPQSQISKIKPEEAGTAKRS